MRFEKVRGSEGGRSVARTVYCVSSKTNNLPLVASLSAPRSVIVGATTSAGQSCMTRSGRSTRTLNW